MTTTPTTTTTNLACPACSAPFSADDVHVDLGIANCRVCRGVLDLRATQHPLDLPRPSHITVEENGERLSLTVPWRRRQHLVAMILLPAFWATAVYFFVFSIEEPDFKGFLDPLVLGLYVVVVPLTYVTLSGLCNRTRITVDGAGWLRLMHAPLGWFWTGQYHFAAAKIAQLYTVRDHRRDCYTLVAMDAGLCRVDLLRNLVTYEDARFVERALERRLGIPDRRVEGEARR
jgi:hypothetical protein